MNTLYFLHIHKGAGTTFVNLARANGVRLYPKNKNGNPHLSSDVSKLRFWTWSPGDQLAFLRSGAAEMYCNETVIGPTMLSDPGFAYVTVLRDPLDRTLSQYHHHCRAHGITDVTFGDFIRKAKAPWLRNYITKQFAETNARPKDITEHDLQVAKKRLAQFDLVLHQGTLSDDLSQLRAYGWNDIDAAAHRKGTRANSNARAMLKDDPVALRLLEEMNEYDLRLLEFYHRDLRPQQEPTRRKITPPVPVEPTLDSDSIEPFRAFAELAAMRGERRQALDILKRGMERFPGVKVLQDEYALIRDARYSRFDSLLSKAGVLTSSILKAVRKAS